MTSIHDNAPRFTPQRPSVESWFARANDPGSARALWVKATVLCRDDGSAVAEAWVSLFDGDRTIAARQTIDLSRATITNTIDPVAHREDVDRLNIAIAETSIGLGSQGGSLRGQIASTDGQLSWELSMDRHPTSLGAPLSLLPSRRLIDAPIPKNKLLTPFPVASFTGSVTWGEDTWNIDNWLGMQGHNWGDAHSPEYAWGQCLFTDSAGEPVAMVEGASGRIRIGPTTSPLLSMLTVRHDDREFRFDRLVNLWRQRPKLNFPQWRLEMSNGQARADLIMRANPTRMVCLGYDNPNATRSYCLNSKTASAWLRVVPGNGESQLEFHTATGAALEFLQPTQHDLVQPIV